MRRLELSVRQREDGRSVGTNEPDKDERSKRDETTLSESGAPLPPAVLRKSAQGTDLKEFAEDPDFERVRKLQKRKELTNSSEGPKV